MKLKRHENFKNNFDQIGVNIELIFFNREIFDPPSSLGIVIFVRNDLSFEN